MVSKLGLSIFICIITAISTLPPNWYIVQDMFFEDYNTYATTIALSSNTIDQTINNMNAVPVNATIDQNFENKMKNFCYPYGSTSGPQESQTAVLVKSKAVRGSVKVVKVEAQPMKCLVARDVFYKLYFCTGKKTVWKGNEEAMVRYIYRLMPDLDEPINEIRTLPVVFVESYKEYDINS